MHKGNIRGNNPQTYNFVYYVKRHHLRHQPWEVQHIVISCGSSLNQRSMTASPIYICKEGRLAGKQTEAFFSIHSFHSWTPASLGIAP